MNKKNNQYSVHFLGEICWLPPHKPERKMFQPMTNFRALGKFTSDFSEPEMTVLINYSSFHLHNSPNCHKVRLHFAFLNGKVDEINRLSKNCEVLILDAYKVIAVCRNIRLSESGAEKMEDEWLE